MTAYLSNPRREAQAVANPSPAPAFHSSPPLTQAGPYESIPMQSHIAQPAGRREKSFSEESAPLLPTSEPLTEKQRKAQKLKEKLAARPTFRPYFMYLVLIIQVIVMIIMLADAGGIETIGFLPARETATTNATALSAGQDVSRWKLINMYIGPSTATVVRHGAKYAPCMRKDSLLFFEITEEQYQEESYSCLGQDECGLIPEAICGQFPQTKNCTALGCSDSQIVLRPCCSYLNGTCQIATKEYCDYYQGKWITTATSCSEVQCYGETCGMTMPDPLHPDQWWRFFTSLFVNAGILQLGANGLIQASMGFRIERKIGWLRMGILFFIAGVGGNIFAGVFSPYIPHAGSSPAMYGFFGIMIVDLLQTWQIQRSPVRELIGLWIQIAIFLVLGTLPWFNNLANFGGLIFGIMGAAVFLPFISFGAWDKFRKRCLVVIMFPILILSFLVLLLLFYNVTDPNFCSFCKFIQCVPYAKQLCDYQP